MALYVLIDFECFLSPSAAFRKMSQKMIMDSKPQKRVLAQPQC